MGTNLPRAELALEQLIQSLKRLPGIGAKTATRLAHFILRQPEDFANQLSQHILEARHRIYTCITCCTFSEAPQCIICANPERSEAVICVVEDPSDVSALERAHQFSGKYHVLHGAISPLDHIDESKLRIRELIERLQKGGIEEVILATNPTVEGDTTALYIARLLKYNGVKLSRIAHGIPVGSEIEYLDGATLGKALQNRVLM